MTRRSFITDMLKVGIATTFLPGAGRIWKPTYSRLECATAATIRPDDLPKHTHTILPFWLETVRWSHWHSDEYKQYLEKLYRDSKVQKFGDS